MIFNTNSRKSNAIYSSFASMASQFLRLIMGFVYRTFFLYILSAEYLGINSLFANILQIFALADLGIGAAILYRMYKPFSDRNINDISKYLNFYKVVYRLIALFIFIMGIAFVPFIKEVVNISEIPQDVNIYVVYILFLFDTISSYFFTYKQSVLIADQKDYVVSIYGTSLIFMKYVAQLILLFVTKKYIFVLAIGIILNVISNWIFSIWITKKYKELFTKDVRLSKEEQRSIMSDTVGVLCHKIGGTVVSSTDSIVLSKYVSLVSVGLYANYQLVFSTALNVVGSALSSFTSSIANQIINSTKEETYKLFLKLQFATVWIASIMSVCIYTFISPFISLWLGETYILDNFTVVMLTISLYIGITNSICASFISASGLFMKDKIRPLIESLINLILSIILAKKIGIAGVFVGTVISALATYYWRVPYLLFKYVFTDISPKIFIKRNMESVIVTIALCYMVSHVYALVNLTWVTFCIGVVTLFFMLNIVYCIIFRNHPDYLYFKDFFINKIRIKKN